MLVMGKSSTDEDSSVFPEQHGYMIKLGITIAAGIFAQVLIELLMACCKLGHKHGFEEGSGHSTEGHGHGHGQGQNDDVDSDAGKGLHDMMGVIPVNSKKGSHDHNAPGHAHGDNSKGSGQGEEGSKPHGGNSDDEDMSNGMIKKAEHGGPNEESHAKAPKDDLQFPHTPDQTQLETDRPVITRPMQ